jgi:hypothetical protein
MNYSGQTLELLQRGVLRFMVELSDELVAIFHLRLLYAQPVSVKGQDARALIGPGHC